MVERAEVVSAPCAQLTIEVRDQLLKMFEADPRMIKKQVESLIDREYLERDAVRMKGVFRHLSTFLLQSSGW